MARGSQCKAPLFYFVRHGDYSVEDPNGDGRLTEKGAAQISSVASLLRSLHGSFSVIACSPLRRAIESAHMISSAVSAEVVIEESLEPEGDPAGALAGLYMKRGGPMIVVGHQPSLSRAIAGLCNDLETTRKIEKGGIACVYAEIRGGSLACSLRWILTPDGVRSARDNHA